MPEYPVTLIAIEVVEAIAIVALIVMVIKLWREIEVPG